MKPPNGAARVEVLRPKTGRVTLVVEHALALIGCAMVARSVFEHAQRGGEAFWSGALGSRRFALSQSFRSSAKVATE